MYRIQYKVKLNLSLEFSFLLYYYSMFTSMFFILYWPKQREKQKALALDPTLEEDRLQKNSTTFNQYN